MHKLPAGRTALLFVTSHCGPCFPHTSPWALGHQTTCTFTPSLSGTYVFHSEVTGTMWPWLSLGSNHFQDKERKAPSLFCIGPSCKARNRVAASWSTPAVNRYGLTTRHSVRRTSTGESGERQSGQSVLQELSHQQESPLAPPPTLGEFFMLPRVPFYPVNGMGINLVQALECFGYETGEWGGKGQSGLTMRYSQWSSVIRQSGPWTQHINPNSSLPHLLPRRCWGSHWPHAGASWLWP